MSALDLRREAKRDPLPALEIASIDPVDLEAARTNWRERMASEHASARVFGTLVGQMMRAGLPGHETYRVAQMAQQELDHGLLCARVLVALGAEPVAELPRLDAVPEHEGAPPLEAVLRNIISIGCCSETVAVALVATEREQVGPPAIRRVLGQILADEVKHSRFGWRILTRVAPELETSLRESLTEYLVDVFEHQIAFHSGFAAMPCASDEGIAIGAPHGQSSWIVFTRTIEQVIVPGLQRCGLDARWAWDEASRPTRSACRAS